MNSKDLKTMFLILLVGLCMRPTGAQDSASNDNIDLLREQGESISL